MPSKAEEKRRAERAAYMRGYRARKKAEAEAGGVAPGLNEPDAFAEFLGALGQGVSGLLRQRAWEKRLVTIGHIKAFN